MAQEHDEAMAQPLLPDDLWNLVEPLLPPEPSKARGGRPRIPAKRVLTGVLFVLRSGIPWEMLPQEMGCGSGMTCWRRLREWQAAGVWQRLHEVLLARLHATDAIDWERACVDSASVPAPGGAKTPGATPPTAASSAPSVTWPPTAMASRWRCSRVARTVTT